MTREEEIIEASQLYAKAYQKPFLDGAKWADKTNHWRPSKEQMKALKNAFNEGRIVFADMQILATLYEQLKTL